MVTKNKHIIAALKYACLSCQSQSLEVFDDFYTKTDIEEDSTQSINIYCYGENLIDIEEIICYRDGKRCNKKDKIPFYIKLKKYHQNI